MDRFLAPSSPEAIAHDHLTENWISWDIEHPALDETLIAGCAAYKAFARFLSGKDLFILPTTRDELASVLQRYAKDSIHNTISGARNALQPGGYTRVIQLSRRSIQRVLDTDDNTSVLLSLHVNATDYASMSGLQQSSGRPIASSG